MEQKFSVLLTVYYKDNPLWLKQAINSVLENTVCPNEFVIMVDGPIPEEIQKILDEASQNKIVRILSQPNNAGHGAALAYGVPKCKYELIALMDADDICRKDRFEKQLAYFAGHPNVVIIGAWIQEMDGDTLQTVAIRKVPLTDKEIKKRIKTRSPFNHVSVMFKKSKVLDAGNYQSFYLMEDYYLWVRMIAKGYEMANIADILVDVRVGKDMYKRRGGWAYFCVNKRLFDEMRKLGLINFMDYVYTLSVRFIVQVLMPNCIRSYFYKRVLR